MSGKEPQGTATAGLPQGADIKEHTQPAQPGLQAEMETQPESTKLPTQHGGQDVLTLEEYRGAAKLRGKVLLITGGDSGIGRAVALLAAREMAAGIAITYMEHEQADADEVRTLVEAEAAAAARLIDATVGAFSRLDHLVLNAAYQAYNPSIEDTSAEILEHTFRVNLFSMFFLAKHAVPHLPRGGAIVCSTSVTAYQGSARLVEYSASKAAIVGLVRSLAKQLAPRGVRVNGVSAGPILTPLNPASRPQENLEEWMAKDVPLGRIGQPVEAATSYIFLMSSDACFFAGQVLHPNGGNVING